VVYANNRAKNLLKNSKDIHNFRSNSELDQAVRPYSQNTEKEEENNILYSEPEGSKLAPKLICS
jgi:hypothetical protein